MAISELQSFAALQFTANLESIIPSLESAHAIATGLILASSVATEIRQALDLSAD